MLHLHLKANINKILSIRPTYLQKYITTIMGKNKSCFYYNIHYLFILFFLDVLFILWNRSKCHGI